MLIQSREVAEPGRPEHWNLLTNLNFACATHKTMSHLPDYCCSRAQPRLSDRQNHRSAASKPHLFAAKSSQIAGKVAVEIPGSATIAAGQASQPGEAVPRFERRARQTIAQVQYSVHT
jgi:hypothetical protein